MANKEKNLVKRLVQNISPRVALDAYNSVGGVVKVNELPKVGEENVIYELTKEKELDSTFSYVLETCGRFSFDQGRIQCILAAESETSDVPELLHDAGIYYVEENSFLARFEFDKPSYLHLYENYSSVFYREIKDTIEYYVICKNYTVEDRGKYLIWNFTLIDGDTFTYVENETEGVLASCRKLKKISSNDLEAMRTGIQIFEDNYLVYEAETIHEISEFPNASQALLLIDNQGMCFVKKDGKIYGNRTTVEGVYFYNNKMCKFYNDDEAGKEEYTGNLTWDEAILITENEIIYPRADNLPTYIFQPLPGELVTEKTKWIYDKGQYVGAGLFTCGEALPEPKDAYKNAIYQASKTVVQGGNWVLESIPSRYGDVGGFSTYVINRWDEVNTYKNNSGLYTFFYNRATNELRAYIYNGIMQTMDLIFEFEEIASGSFHGVYDNNGTEEHYYANIYLNVTDINDSLYGTVTRLDGTVEENVMLEHPEIVEHHNYLGHMILKEVKGQELYGIKKYVYEDEPYQSYYLSGLPMQTYNSVEELPNAVGALDYVNGEGIMYAKVGDTVYVNKTWSNTYQYSWNGNQEHCRFEQMGEGIEGPQYTGALEWEEVTIEATTDSVPSIPSEPGNWTKFYLINEVPSSEYHVFQNFVLNADGRWVAITEEYTDKE